jgi:autotransporter-associated beta strand protein
MNTTTNTIKRAAGLIVIIGLTALPLRAADYYWNFDGDGDWHATQLSVWAPAATGGTSPTANTTAADNVYFSANGITAGTVTVNGTQLANELWLNQAFNFTGGTIDLSTGASGLLRVAASGTIGSALKTKGIYFSAANQTLTLVGGSPLLTQNGQHITGETTARKTATLRLTNGLYNIGGGQFNSNIGDFDNPNAGGLVLGVGGTLSATVSNQIGSSGDGVLRIEGGNWDEGNGDFVIGRGNDNRGLVILTSGSITQAATRDLLVGFQGNNNTTGRLDINGGVLDIKGAIAINATSAGAKGEVNINGGTSSVGQILLGKGINYAASNAGSATLNVTGGRLDIGANGIKNEGTGTSTYAINLNGGTVGATAAWSSTLQMTLGTTATTSGITFDTTGGDITLNGILDGTGNLTKAGTGTLLLTGANTYAGDTIVDAGILELGNTAALGLAADLSLLSGVTVDLNYTGNATIDHLLLDGVIIDNLTIDTAYTTAQLNTILGGVNIFNGTGLLTISAIPEPSAPALLLFGLISAVILRWRTNAGRKNRA